MVTIPDLNKRAYFALAERLVNPSDKLHGILAPCPKPGTVQVLWAYGEVLAALEATDRSRCDDVFYKGRLSLHDFLSCYLRSCQLLGLAGRRLEQKMEDDCRDRQLHRGQDSWSVKVDLEVPYGRFHSSIDVIIHLDSCISYLKILVDGVAKTVPSIFGAPPFLDSRDSMNSLWKAALKRAGSPLARVFGSARRDWLDILSAPRVKVAGIRDARVHHGAQNIPLGHALGNGPIRLLVQQSSVGRERIGGRPPETIKDAVIHSSDVVSDLVRATTGFFSFLDQVVREAAAQNPALSPLRRPYSKSGYVLAFGPSHSLTSVVPLV